MNLFTLILSLELLGRGKETSFNSSRLSFLLSTVEEGETIHKDPLRVYTCSSASLPTPECDTMEMEKMKVCSYN